MKILLVTYWPYPHTGGVTTHLQGMSSRLEDLGHEVEVLAQHPNLSHYYLAKEGRMIPKQPLLDQAEATVIARMRQEQTSLTSWLMHKEIEKAAFGLACSQAKLELYDIIHAHDIYASALCGIHKPMHTPLIASIHGCLATEWVVNGEIRYRTAQERAYLVCEEYRGVMSADHVIVPSRWLTRRMQGLGVHHANTTHIPYGLDQELYAHSMSLPLMKAVPMQAQGGDKLVIACPARLVAIKGHVYLLKALARLHDSGRQFVCWIIGDGMLRKTLEEHIATLGLESSVYLLGKRMDIPQLLSRADIVVLPSLQDNLPYSIIEAQSAGKPVVASGVGGIVEMIRDGVDGFLVEPANADMLYQKLALLIDDPALRHSQSQQAVTKRAQWDEAVMTRRILDIYTEARAAVNLANVGVTATDNSDTDHIICSHPWESLEFIMPEESEQRSIFLAGGAPDSLARELSDISGVVKGQRTGQPIPDAGLHLLDCGGMVLYNARSGHDGAFQLNDVQPGSYELVCVKEDHKPYTQKITLHTSSELRITAVLGEVENE
ncbi:N,N'-diacetylbacillosaminyl-diphospho-undecaprenol alpha-1,3-N-acetylgalactosaminyltransferase [compost metagenome]